MFLEHTARETNYSKENFFHRQNLNIVFKEN